jgi:two-component system nitrogen regulation response regulator NtrX
MAGLRGWGRGHPFLPRESIEREYILKKLEETSGNVTRTAELLGLERSNLYRKMKALGIGPPPT